MEIDPLGDGPKIIVASGLGALVGALLGEEPLKRRIPKGIAGAITAYYFGPVFGGVSILGLQLSLELASFVVGSFGAALMGGFMILAQKFRENPFEIIDRFRGLK